MQLISLTNDANQAFTTTQDNNVYDIRIIETNGCMSVDITCNDIQITDGSRITLGQPLIPFKYQFLGKGNFFFISSTDDLIYYPLFGTVQQLYYISNAEMVSLGILPA